VKSFSSLSLTDDSKLKGVKEEISKKLTLCQGLVARSFNRPHATLVSMNINGSTAGKQSSAGNPARRRIIGESFLAACQADIVLFQDSNWKPDKVIVHFNAIFTSRRYAAIGERCAFVVFDQCKYKQVAVPTAGLFSAKNLKQKIAAQHFDLRDPRYALRSRGTPAQLVLSAINYTLERLTMVLLQEITTDRRIIVCSYHGPYRCTELHTIACASWAYALVIDWARQCNCQFIIGGDFNADVEDLAPVLPTHNHDPRRPNLYDWILPSSPTVLLGQVNYCAIFPLPLANPIVDGEFTLLPPVVAADDSEIEVFYPWEEERWVLLDLILGREHQTIEWLMEVFHGEYI
jgi:hypothetical protein